MKTLITGGVMKTKLSRRLMIPLGLALAIAALVAPSANAKMQRIYSDRGVALIPVTSEPSPNMAYSDRGVVPITPDSKPTLVYSDRGVAVIPSEPNGPQPIAAVSTSDPSGFNWGRVGLIVSLAVAGLLLLAGGALLAGRQTRRRRLAAA
jgi:hypothetical protein